MGNAPGNMRTNDGGYDPPVPAFGPLQTVRALVGGTLMGLANLVPGISGGTMLVASGVYERFIVGVSDLARLRFRLVAIVPLALIVGAALASIVLLAEPVKDLVVNHTWIMFSLFIGLTLGGVPVVWRMLDRATVPMYLGAVMGFCAMVALALLPDAGSGGAGQSRMLMLFLGGLLGAAAMVLPGISGAYLLLLLGQYVPILASVGRCKDAVAARDLGALAAEWTVIVPTGLGVLVGVFGVSTLMRWLLAAFPRPTLGVLLGVLVGSVAGLWPFASPREPAVGEVVRGLEVVRIDEAGGVRTVMGRVPPDAEREIPAEDWPRDRYRPTLAQAGASAGLIVVGVGLTSLIGRLGGTARTRR